MSTVGVDIPEADLLLVGDAFFGSTVFLSSAGIPEKIRGALKQLQTKNRSRVIPGHIGIYDNKTFENALFYLDSLQTQVETAHNSPAGEKRFSKFRLVIVWLRRLQHQSLKRNFTKSISG